MPGLEPTWVRRWAPEGLLSALAILVFLGSLGSMEFWGKREQRAVAESIDTLDQNHWLVAEIQNRPRLEKPPLPRWTLALTMAVTNCRDEWLLRFPRRSRAWAWCCSRMLWAVVSPADPSASPRASRWSPPSS